MKKVPEAFYIVAVKFGEHFVFGFGMPTQLLSKKEALRQAQGEIDSGAEAVIVKLPVLPFKKKLSN